MTSIRAFLGWPLSASLALSVCAPNARADASDGKNAADFVERVYAQSLANFGEVPLDIGAAESAAAIGDVFEEVRVIIFDVDDNGWLVSVDGTVLSDVEPYSTLFVSVSESKPYEQQVVIDAIKVDGYYEYQEVLTNYFTHTDHSVFLNLKSALLTQSFLETPVYPKQDVRELKSSPCATSGRRLFIEAILNGRRNLIFRTVCAGGFNEGLQLAMPALNATRQNIEILDNAISNVVAPVEMGNVN